MIVRLICLVYWCIGALVGLSAMVYLVGFVANSRVPATIDLGFNAYLPFQDALATDIPLLLLFGLQHSLMPRRFFKDRLPLHWHRSTYLLATGLVLFYIFRKWEPMPDLLWHLRGDWARLVVRALLLGGVALVVWSVAAIGAADFLGLRAVLAYFLRRSYSPPQLRMAGPYRYGRHPMMAGTMLVLWSTPEMSRGHLLFAGFMLAYTLLALRFEVADLRAEYGDAYPPKRAPVHSSRFRL